MKTYRSLWNWHMWTVLALLGLLLMVTASVVLAESGQEPTDLLEIGVEYINDYPGWWNDLSKRDDDALGLYNSLGSAGWVKRFAYGNYWAWEEDFKRWSRGGTEWRYVDTVDLAY